MFRRIVLVAIAATALFAAVAVAVVARGEAASPQVIPYFEDFNPKGGGGFAAFEAKPIEKAGVTRDVGASVYFSSILRSRKGGPRIGRNVAECRVTGFKVDLCRGVILLKHRGSLTIDGFASSATGAHVRTIPIVGGTGQFAGARGYIESAKQSDSGPGINWTIHLMD